MTVVRRAYPSRKASADTLQQLQCLRTLKLSNLTGDNSSQAWAPVLDAIRRNPLLEDVFVTGRYYDIVNGETEILYWGADKLEPLQFGPRLNKAKQQFLSKVTISAKDFVDALISVRDSVDCLDHLLSQTDPNLYAHQATTLEWTSSRGLGSIRKIRNQKEATDILNRHIRSYAPFLSILSILDCCLGETVTGALPRSLLLHLRIQKGFSGSNPTSLLYWNLEHGSKPTKRQKGQ